MIADHIRQVPAVHSLKLRAKSPEHLVEKIIRKRLEKPDIEITPENYPTVITDLVGVRALHLFKDDWKPIHDVVTKTWDLHETPLAYIREGDSKDVREQFEAAGCNVQEHPHGYRSVHYLIISKPTKETVITELQVRTIFEEGWSEIDHRIRYPYKKNELLLSQYLVLMNRLAGNADEMGTFIKNLDAAIAEERAKVKEAEKALEKKEQALKEAISKLKVSEEEKKALRKQIDELKPMTFLPSTVKISDLISDLNIGMEAISGLGSGLTVTAASLGSIGVGGESKKCTTCGASYVTSIFANDCPKCGTRN